MKSFLVWLLFMSSSVFAGGIANLNKQGVILDGFDVVSYFKGSTPVKGLPNLQLKHNDAIYLFASEENKQEFQKDPKKYEPQFGGWCAYAVADSKSKVDIDPKSFVIQDGRLLLFYKGIWGNTREKWLHTDGKDSKIFLKEADQNWTEVKIKDP